MFNRQIPQGKNKKKPKMPKFLAGQKVTIGKGRITGRIKTISGKQAIIQIKQKHAKQPTLRKEGNLLGRETYAPQITQTKMLKVQITDVTPRIRNPTKRTLLPARIDPHARRLNELFELRRQLKQLNAKKTEGDRKAISEKIKELKNKIRKTERAL